MIDSFLTQVLKAVVVLDVLAAIFYIALTALILPLKRTQSNQYCGHPLVGAELAAAVPAGGWLTSFPVQAVPQCGQPQRQGTSIDEELDRIGRSLDDVMNTGLDGNVSEQ